MIDGGSFSSRNKNGEAEESRVRLSNCLIWDRADLKGLSMNEFQESFSSDEVQGR